MVIPFIKGNLDFDQRKVDLQIMTEKGYTVYDREEGMAFVQISRGPDNVTLHGMEVMIEFEGTTYKTTLRAPNAKEQKRYFFDMKSMEGKLPGAVSVAPIFILDARQILGAITSKVMMPIMDIVKDYDTIIAELDKNTEFINLTVENQTIDLIKYCPNNNGIGRDPWGGCPIAAGDIEKVNLVEEDTVFKIYYSGSQPPIAKTSQAYLKFGGEGNCIPSNYADECISLGSLNWWGPSGSQWRIVVPKASLTVNTGDTNCGQNNWFYLYKNSDCKN
jgi:hypothetical protein